MRLASRRRWFCSSCIGLTLLLADNAFGQDLYIGPLPEQPAATTTPANSGHAFDDPRNFNGSLGFAIGYVPYIEDTTTFDYRDGYALIAQFGFEQDDEDRRRRSYGEFRYVQAEGEITPSAVQGEYRLQSISGTLNEMFMPPHEEAGFFYGGGFGFAQMTKTLEAEDGRDISEGSFAWLVRLNVGAELLSSEKSSLNIGFDLEAALPYFDDDGESGASLFLTPTVYLLFESRF